MPRAICRLLPILSCLAVALPQVASAQFVPPEDEGFTPPPPPPAETTEPAASTAPANASEPAGREAGATEAKGGAPAASGGPTLPTDFTVGVGAGWVFPGAEVLSPNVGLTRLRVTPEIEVEGALNLGFGSGSTKTDINPDDNTMDTEDRTAHFALALSVDVRYAALRGAHAEFVAGGGIGVGFTGQETDPDGPDNIQRTLSTSLAAQWLLGVNWFVTQNFAVSADVRNPLLSYTNQSTEIPSEDRVDSTTSLDLGLIFAPQARITLLFYLD
ncbi:MAG: hypothetical protein D6729_12710 [Deltaproteobacteria bacterium]|nr:MAG: hypothetical protein D6729_12710 [Deltaproteobacteria bacterium]